MECTNSECSYRFEWMTESSNQKETVWKRSQESLRNLAPALPCNGHCVLVWVTAVCPCLNKALDSASEGDHFMDHHHQQPASAANWFNRFPMPVNWVVLYSSRSSQRIRAQSSYLWLSFTFSIFLIYFYFSNYSIYWRTEKVSNVNFNGILCSCIEIRLFSSILR